MQNTKMDILIAIGKVYWKVFLFDSQGIPSVTKRPTLGIDLRRVYKLSLQSPFSYWIGRLFDDMSEDMFSKRLLIITVRHLLLLTVVILSFIVLVDFTAFPAFESALIKKLKGQNCKTVGSYFITTADDQKIEILCIKADNERGIAIIASGNGSWIDPNDPKAVWASKHGLTSYQINYRGFGGSSGWPSENGFYNDIEALWNHISNEKELSKLPVYVIGHSFGTVPAAYVASKHQVAVLVILAGYTNVSELLQNISPWTKFLIPLIRYEFRTAKYLKNTKAKKVYLFHGKQDRVVPFALAEQLQALFEDRNNFKFIFFDDANHQSVVARGLQTLNNELEF